MRAKEEQWQKAVVVGSIWASVEIILGSFLHNLRVPFSGSTLAMIGVILVSSFMLRWKTQGVVLRAALICALMKSISPSSVILGPMTGILLEGLLIELSFRVLGFNFLSALVAGVLAVSSALLHKIVNLLLIYGEDIIRIYVNLFQFAARQLNYPGAGSSELLFLLLTGYALLGILAGIMGYRISRWQPRGDVLPGGDHKWEKHRVIASLPKLHTLWLIMHILILVGGLILMNMHGLLIFVTLGLPYLILVLIRYKQAIRRLSKPSLWYQLALMIILSALFYDFPAYSSTLGTLKGVEAGIELVLRALFVIMVFTAVSVELKNPKVEKFLKGAGFSRLHEMMILAFSVLPEVIAAMPKIRYIISRPLASLAQMNLVGEKMIKKAGSNIGFGQASERADD